MSLDLDEEPEQLTRYVEGRRWIGGGFHPRSLAIVTEDVVAIRNSSHIQFLFLQTGKTRVFTPPKGKGVGVIAGRDDLACVAWSEAGPRPNVHVVRYANTLEVADLEGKTKFTLPNFIFCIIIIKISLF